MFFQQSLALRLPNRDMGRSFGMGESLSVTPDGDVFWSRQASFRLACPLDLKRLPFDTQHCSVVIGLYTDTADDVMLAWRRNVLAFTGWETSCMNG